MKCNIVDLWTVKLLLMLASVNVVVASLYTVYEVDLYSSSVLLQASLSVGVEACILLFIS